MKWRGAGSLSKRDKIVKKIIIIKKNWNNNFTLLKIRNRHFSISNVLDRIRIHVSWMPLLEAQVAHQAHTPKRHQRLFPHLDHSCKAQWSACSFVRASPSLRASRSKIKTLDCLTESGNGSEILNISRASWLRFAVGISCCVLDDHARGLVCQGWRKFQRSGSLTNS